jgi:hypothetical protein
MSPPVASQVEALPRLTIPELRQRFAELFGAPRPRTSNRVWLIRRIAWRLQALAEGGLTERARRRATELACAADLRHLPPRPAKTTSGTTPAPAAEGADPRLPSPGTMLHRIYKGRALQVLVRTDGFEHEGQLFASLSAVARAVTGSHCNGFAFFRLARRGGGR